MLIALVLIILFLFYKKIILLNEDSLVIQDVRKDCT